jgi:probable rRNA maturation factor
MDCLVFYTIKNKQKVPRAKDIQSTVAYVLKCEKAKGSLSIHIIADTKMKRLQKEHRGKTTTTDVLSFAAQEGSWKGANNETDLGDIFISWPQILRQAKTWHVTPVQEFYRMLIHGTLHILGYDHIKKTEAEQMFSKQEKYLNNCI